MSKKKKSPACPVEVDPFAAFLAEAITLKRKPAASRASTPSKSTEDIMDAWRNVRLAECKPVSVHLHVKHQHCTGCGKNYVSMNDRPLVRKVGIELEHWEMIDNSMLEIYENLPRIRHDTTVQLNECIGCFHQTEIKEEKK